MGFTGPLIPVHPRHQKAFGRPAVRSLRDLAEPVDLAFILAPTQAVESVIDDMAAAGVRNAVVLAAGYREVGAGGPGAGGRPGGAGSQPRHRAARPELPGLPQHPAKAAPFALAVPLPLTAGPVGIALQSGALASAVLAFARSQAIGVSTLTTLGNEAMITTADMVDYLVEDEDTKVICLFLEEISDPARSARRRASRPGGQADRGAEGRAPARPARRRRWPTPARWPATTPSSTPSCASSTSSG